MKISEKENWETFWKEKSHLPEVYANTERIRLNLMKVLPDLRGKNILEVGAGTGRDSFYMAKDGARLFLLDYSKNSLKLIASNQPEKVNISAIGGNAFSLPFRDEMFDVVFHQGLLEHFRKPEATKLLKENIRVLKRGGFLIVDVPQRWHIYTIIKHVLIALNSWFAGWEREFSTNELSLLLQRLGLQKRLIYGEWMYPSLFYRTIREVFMKVGIKLPLYPVFSQTTSKLRSKIRTLFDGTWMQVNTALSIGIIAEK